MPTLGLILAGGRARRMGGGDKPLLPVGGRPILAHVIDRLRPQVAALLLNANGDPARFAEFGLPVAADSLDGYQGPLAGVLAGLDWAARHAPEIGWVLSVPGDAPFLPRDLAHRLHAARGPAGLACAESGGQVHPVVALWPVGLAGALRAALDSGQRTVRAFTSAYDVGIATWPIAPVDPFLNVNRPEDAASADRLAGLDDA